MCDWKLDILRYIQFQTGRFLIISSSHQILKVLFVPQNINMRFKDWVTTGAKTEHFWHYLIVTIWPASDYHHIFSLIAAYRNPPNKPVKEQDSEGTFCVFFLLTKISIQWIIPPCVLPKVSLWFPNCLLNWYYTCHTIHIYGACQITFYNTENSFTDMSEEKSTQSFDTNGFTGMWLLFHVKCRKNVLSSYK